MQKRNKRLAAAVVTMAAKDDKISHFDVVTAKSIVVEDRITAKSVVVLDGMMAGRGFAINDAGDTRVFLGTEENGSGLVFSVVSEGQGAGGGGVARKRRWYFRLP